MRHRRWIFLATGLALLGLATWFVVIGIDRADKMASVVGALGTVAGVGISLWALVTPAGARTPQRMIARKSGTIRTATGSTGDANTGIRARADAHTIIAEDTGAIDADGHGDLNTGVQLD